jgi:uncharacterized protein (DUF58 family)
MKKLVLLLFVTLFASVLYAQTSGPVLAFKEKEVNFGNIVQGAKVEHTFAFENKGNAPLIISNVAVTCGCTATSWPKEPIAPGQTSQIKISFNSAGKMGAQNSVVRIYSNATEPIEKVTLISNVVTK